MTSLSILAGRIVDDHLHTNGDICNRDCHAIDDFNRGRTSIFINNNSVTCLFVCLFVLLLYVPSQQLWSWRDCQFTLPHFFPGQA